MDTDMFDKVPPELNPSTLSPLHIPFHIKSDIFLTLDATSSITYNTSASLNNLGAISAYHEMNDTSFVSIPAMAQPRVTKTIDLEVIFDTMDDGTNHAMFNQVTFNFPVVPSVLSALTLGANATVAKAYGPLSFVVEYGDVVDLVVKNGDVGKHPLQVYFLLEFGLLAHRSFP
jgi:iron transport multicopper oxidase